MRMGRRSEDHESLHSTVEENIPFLRMGIIKQARKECPGRSDVQGEDSDSQLYMPAFVI